MRKIVIIADSLCLPRPQDQGDIPFEATYPYQLDIKLRSEFGSASALVVEKGKRGRTVSEVVADWTEYVTLRKPDVVVMQVGIVDCAPRIFTPRQQIFVEGIRFQLLKNLVLAVVKKYRRQIIKSFPDRTYTNPDIFRQKLYEIVGLAERDNVKNLIIVNIITPPDDFEYRSPGAQANVSKYNQIIDKVSNDMKTKKMITVVNVDEEFHKGGRLNDYILSDGHHLSVQGNKVVARLLEDILLKSLPKEICGD